MFTTEGELKQEDPNLALIPALNRFEGGIVEGETLNYTIGRTTGEAEGTYDITVTMGENPNYDVREVTGGTFTILESLGVMQTITGDDVTATYGDTGVKSNASLTEGDVAVVCVGSNRKKEGEFFASANEKMKKKPRARRSSWRSTPAARSSWRSGSSMPTQSS